MLSVIIPAHNEEAWIGSCLAALVAQGAGAPDRLEIIVAANACTDTTVAVAEGYRAGIEARGWHFQVLDMPEGGKPNALNRADAAATGDQRLYLDADIVCDGDMLEQISAALARPEPCYAGGRLVVAPAQSWVTRQYGRLWSRLPFMTASGTTGAGLFAVNAAGRARWGDFPGIISDDGYVRMLFTPAERITVASSYLWPMVEGFAALVRVRRRQDAGNRELAALYPELVANEGKPGVTPGDHVRLFLGQPVSYLVYVVVSLAVRAGARKGAEGWARGR
jgi:glycosyltransferase involved in cell wall biosynthesis